MTLAQIVTVLAAIGGPAGIVAIIMVLPQIRKLQADTARVEKDADNADIDGASVLSTAALSQMTAAVERAQRAEAHADRLEARVGDLMERMNEVEASLRAYHRIAQDHATWDIERIEELVAMGIAREQIPPPPPLLPPPGQRVA